MRRGETVAIIGKNRPEMVWSEVAAHAVGCMSLGIYHDAMNQEVAYLVDYAEVRIVLAEDEEQVDKLLEIAADLVLHREDRLLRSARHAQVRRIRG